MKENTKDFLYKKTNKKIISILIIISVILGTVISISGLIYGKAIDYELENKLININLISSLEINKKKTEVLENKLTQKQTPNQVITTVKINNSDELKKLNEKIKDLESQPKQELIINGSSELDFKSFIPLIIQIQCVGPNYLSKGSGTIISPNTIQTNYHVVKGFENCAIGFTTNSREAPSEWVNGTVISLDKTNDRAILVVNSSYANKTIKKCNYVDTHEGDKLVILGYPRIGGATLTITDGIISGFESPYIKTSAKISEGNSGGAAIHQSGCYLGIPTLARIDSEIESLGYILDDTIGGGLKNSGNSMITIENQQDIDVSKYEPYLVDYKAFKNTLDNINSSFGAEEARMNDGLELLFQSSYVSSNETMSEARNGLILIENNILRLKSFTFFEEIDYFKKQYIDLIETMLKIIDAAKKYNIAKKANDVTSAYYATADLKEWYKELNEKHKVFDILLQNINEKGNRYFSF